jgi:adenosylcobinamide kinase / adenosylcobinamide-phosphate guanylyltransferase
MHELILGGQKSGKSRLAQERARAWLAQSASHRAVLMATAVAHDEEMGERIARHRADRLASLPALQCVEEPVHLGRCIEAHSDAHTLILVDCLTMWLTNLLMPASDTRAEVPVLKQNQALALTKTAQSATDLIVNLKHALQVAKGPVVLVSNEIGLGVIPLGREMRTFVDELGKLNQALAAQCEQVTFMAAGCALRLKGAP